MEKRRQPVFHKRPMVGAAFGAVLGVLLGNVLPSFFACVILVVVCCVLGGMLLSRRTGWGLLLLLFALTCLRTMLVPKDTIATGNYLLEGTVAETPEIGANRMTLILRDASINQVPLHARVTLSAPSVEVQYGDTVLVSAEVRPIGSAAEYAHRGIFTSASASASPTILCHRDDPYGALLRLRTSFSAALDRLYGDEAALAKGMLLGDRSDFSYSDTQQFKSHGLLHIFAVSGLHVTILISLIGPLIHTGRRGLDHLLLVLLALFYCALTNFTSSALRAMFFLLGMRLAEMDDRQPDAPSAYCFSMAAVLLFHPYSLFSAGFLLSFASMAGILLLTGPMTNLLHLPDIGPTRAFVGSIAAMLGSLPIQAMLFGEVAWMTIPMSILLAPVFSILFPPAFLSMLLSPFLPWLAKAIAIVPYGALRFVDHLTTWMQSNTLAWKQPHLLAVLLYYTGLLFCSQLWLPNEKHPPYPGMGMLAGAIVLWMIL